MGQYLRYGLAGSVLTALLISGCSGVKTQISEEISPQAAVMPNRANQSFVGVLPCDDCPSIGSIGWQPVSMNKQIDGMLIYMADAPSIVECRTGLRLPVVMTPEWIEVERAYADSRYVAGGYLYIEADAAVAWEEPEEGPARHHLRFGNLKQLVPGKTCGSPTALLANHEWDVVELDGFFSSDLDEMQARPYVRFNGQQLSGRTGCNVMAGTIHIEEDTLSIGPVVSTRMFCQDAEKVESRFLQLMEEAKYSSLEGQQWTWYDKNMKRLMSFERKEAIETSKAIETSTSY